MRFFSTSIDVEKAQTSLVRPNPDPAKPSDLEARLGELGQHRTRLRADLTQVNEEIWRLLPQCVEAGFDDVTELARLAGMTRQSLYQKGLPERRARTALAAEPATHQEASPDEQHER
jgi:hypothetical protein